MTPAPKWAAESVLGFVETPIKRSVRFKAICRPFRAGDFGRVPGVKTPGSVLKSLRDQKAYVTPVQNCEVTSVLMKELADVR
jgi:hypothetical protein